MMSCRMRFSSANLFFDVGLNHLESVASSAPFSVVKA
jgi:hypothetical protein